MFNFVVEAIGILAFVVFVLATMTNVFEMLFVLLLAALLRDPKQVDEVVRKMDGQ